AEHFVEIGQGLFRAVVAEGEEQVFFRSEIGVDGAHGEATFADDVVHGGGVIALTSETGHGRGEDLGAPLLFLGERNFGHVGTDLLGRRAFLPKKTSARFAQLYTW